MDVSRAVAKCLIGAKEMAYEKHHEYITPEHLLYKMCEEISFRQAFEMCGGIVSQLQSMLNDYFGQYLESVDQTHDVVEEDFVPMESLGIQQVLLQASTQVMNSGKEVICMDHIFFGLTQLKESYALYFIEAQGINELDLLRALCDLGQSGGTNQTQKEAHEKQLIEDTTQPSPYLVNLMTQEEKQILIGREVEIERTIQILSRKQKNNPIHMGEPGVGKTAIVKGLTSWIKKEKVPHTLEGAEIFELDLAGMLAGAQYRGDLEKRLKTTLETLKSYQKPIVYIDDIHTIVGAGAIGSGSMDAANLLKPYLEEGKIRFIGSTTFEDYKKYIEKDKGLVRRFQTLEVAEPSIEESIAILKGLQESYEQYHGVQYEEEAIEAAVKLSAQHMNERYLPDKAIDLIDEAGAYVAIKGEGKTQEKQWVTKAMIEELIAKICQIPKKSVQKDEKKHLKNLEATIKSQVFGQEQAVEQVIKRIKLARAGLSDGQKPIASLLFVGPTGVGKTELAKVIAQELGIGLIRFDMSEYTEKHTASKLIGSPPGYVGYNEGGLLTDAIRKTPHCVLLLDEIEKAHADIFNMLLQVMDYATLTDSQGKKADFRNVILLMTSNAGASDMGKQLVGFGERIVKEEVMEEAVKKLFTPEFRNRLNGVIGFKHLEDQQAEQIAKKTLERLKKQLLQQNITLKYTKSCVAYIAKKGVSQQYGAREIARIIENEVSPLLTDEILFGKLTDGGNCQLGISKQGIHLKV